MRAIRSSRKLCGTIRAPTGSRCGCAGSWPWRKRRSKAGEYGATHLLPGICGANNPGDRILYRLGETAFTNDAVAYIEGDYSTLASNEQWESDHHLHDVIVQRSGRTDTGTGNSSRAYFRPVGNVLDGRLLWKIVGFVVYDGDPDTGRILLALRRGVKATACRSPPGWTTARTMPHTRHGRTKKQRRAVNLVHDLPRINGAFAGLDIKAHNVQKFHGQSKNIERFFGTLEDRFGRTFPTYCANKPENKPRI